MGSLQKLDQSCVNRALASRKHMLTIFLGLAVQSAFVFEDDRQYTQALET